MRQFILIAAILLMSASAQADGPRGLSLASNDETVAAGQPKATEAPNVAEQPGDAVPQPPKADQVKPDQARSDQANDQVKSERTKSASGKTEKSKVRRSPLEARVVDELHRHGIYW